MSCKHLIEEELTDLPGIEMVKVDFPHHSAEVKYDEQLINIEKVMEKITELGYQVTIVS
jgi:copper chaperone CopZ